MGSKSFRSGGFELGHEALHLGHVSGIERAVEDVAEGGPVLGASEGEVCGFAAAAPGGAAKLDGLLIAELTDNEGWSSLIDLAAALGQKGMVADSRQALASEEEHLVKVRTWLQSGTLADAKMDLTEQPGEQQEWYEQVFIH